MSDLSSTTRFTDRVADYVRYRPDYPPALLAWLAGQGMAQAAKVADIGAGTGISSKLFLDAGHEVVAVEPNAAMREAAITWLGTNPRFSAVDGSAEATTLADAAVDLVSAAQAFHWFDQQAVKPEWRRILRPGGLVAVFWNSRRLTGTPFLEGYERLLLEYGLDYSSVSERYGDDGHMRRWFGAGLRAMAYFPHTQRLDFAALRGRLLSSSYAPRAGQAGHAPRTSRAAAAISWSTWATSSPARCGPGRRWSACSGWTCRPSPATTNASCSATRRRWPRPMRARGRR